MRDELRHEQFAQFDDLTRNLANGVSRRQALKLLLSAGVTTLFPSLASLGGKRVSAASAAATATCPAANQVNGTWEQLKARAESPGVIDAGNKNYEGWVGVTGYSFRYTGNSSPALEAFRQGNKWCAKTKQPLRMTFAVDTNVCKITWTPTPTPCKTTACQNAIDDWQDKLDTHEAHHVQDTADVLATYNNAPAETHTKCITGGSAQDAANALVADIQRKIESKLFDMNDKLSDLTNNFHKTPAGSPLLLPDEDVCDPCPTGRVCCNEICCAPGEICQNGSCITPQKIWCNCNKTCYDDVNVCLSNCKASLGCFTGICQPAGPGQC